MPQPSRLETTSTTPRRRVEADLAIVVIECHRDDRERVYRGLAELPCRPILIEEPAAMR
jgi:hypothetical protein